MRYVHSSLDQRQKNSRYSITFLLMTSMLFNSNLGASQPLPSVSPISVPEYAKKIQNITKPQAIFKSMVAEFNIENGRVKTGIEEYLPLVFVTPSIGVKRRALELSLESNDIESAYAIASQWVKQEPNDVPALFYLAHTALINHHYQTFANTLDRILAIDENANLEQILSGLLPENAQDREQLLATLNTVQKKDNPSLLVLIATLEAKSGNYERSLFFINKALSKRPNTSSFILLKANLLLAMDKRDKALKWLKKSNDRYKKNPEVRLAEVKMLAEDKNEKQVFKRLNNALKYNPKAEDLLFLAGLTNIDHKNHAQAELYLSKLHQSPRFQNDSFYYLGINAERIGHYESALMYYRQVEGSLYTVSRQSMVKLYERLGLVDDALRFLTQERVNYPNYASFLYQLQAEVLQHAGLKAEALSLLQEASQDLPEDPDLLYLQVVLLDPHKDQNKLEQILNTLLLIEPNSPIYLNAYAYTLALQNRQLNKARQYAEQALEYAPNQASILDTLGYIAFLQNDYQTAVLHLAKAYQQGENLSIGLKYAKALYMYGDLKTFNQVVTQLNQKHPNDEQVSQLSLLILPDNVQPQIQPQISTQQPTEHSQT